MNAIDMIYKEIYKGSLKAGARESSARDAAVIGVSEFKKGRFKKPIDLIEDMIKKAKRGAV